MNNKIEFADGTIIDGSAGSYGSWLHLYIDSTTMLSHMADFTNPEKMAEITYYYGAYKNVYRGFTQFFRVELPPESQEFDVKLHGSGVSVEEKIPTVPEEYLPKE